MSVGRAAFRVKSRSIGPWTPSSYAPKLAGWWTRGKVARNFSVGTFLPWANYPHAAKLALKGCFVRIGWLGKPILVPVIFYFAD